MPALIAVAVLVTGLVSLGSYRYQINPDGVSYIAVARHWLDGHWAEAVNSHWGPMYSWLLMPLLALGLDGLLAAKVGSPGTELEFAL